MSMKLKLHPPKKIRKESGYFFTFLGDFFQDFYRDTFWIFFSFFTTENNPDGFFFSGQK